MNGQSSAEILDRTGLLDRVGDDAAFLLELVAMFSQQRDRLMSEIRAAMQTGDAAALARAAHTLKGCVGNLGGSLAFEAARRVETLARLGQLNEAREAAPQLEEEVTRFERALLRLAEELNRA